MTTEPKVKDTTMHTESRMHPVEGALADKGYTPRVCLHNRPYDFDCPECAAEAEAYHVVGAANEVHFERLLNAAYHSGWRLLQFAPAVSGTDSGYGTYNTYFTAVMVRGKAVAS